jgi:hypothetical protein
MTDTPTHTPTNTPTDTPTNSPTPTDTPLVSATNTPTPTSTPAPCLSRKDKVRQLVNVVRRFGTELGDRHYDARYDLDNDNDIDFDDLKLALYTPVCR